MLIPGACHCRNLTFSLTWDPSPTEIPARACTCSFCVKHGGVWTANPAGALTVTIEDAALISRYEFGTRTAQFHICTRCGVVPVVTSRIEDRLHAVVNVNAFEGVDPSLLRHAAVNLDGEGTDSRLARRQRNWIADVRLAVLAVLVGLAGCGGGGGGGDAGPVDGVPTDAVGPPEARCEAPALYDVTSPAAVIGDGTSASCTEAALRSAAAGGGTVTFNCGPSPVTITVGSAIVVTAETVLDGGGTVTLSGGGTSRILYLDSGYDTPTPRLVVQRLAFRGGQAPAGGEDTAQGGGAIYRDGGSLTVIDSVFDDNHGQLEGQDVAGGAIYGFGGGDIIVAGGIFTNNSASDGGAIGSLNGDLTVINTTFSGNAATGTGGNPGNGGAGGALYMDGRDEVTSLCGVTIADSTAGAIGGGFFRVSNDDTGSFTMDRSTVDHNRVTSTEDGNAGGLYLQGLALVITNSTISRNEAFYNGGIWINACDVQATNVTIAENIATGSNGGGVWLGNGPTGTLRNCTIANNHSTADGQVAGAIFGGGLTLVNTLVAGNRAMYTPGCDESRPDGSGNLQWPGGALCTDDPLVADPLLGALGDHGGDTETMVPAAGSPARALGTGCPATDQRGEPRGDPCTAGAVEVP